MPDIKQFIIQAREKGVSDDEILKFLNENGALNKPTSQPGALSQAAGLVENTIDKAANFMFGATGKTVGSLIAAPILRIQGKEEQAKKLEKNANPLNIGLTALEMTPLGLGEKAFAKATGKLVTPLISRAEKIYQNVLKPTQALLKKSPDVVKTGLKEGVAVTKQGLAKTQGLIETIGEDIGKVIDSGIAQGKTIDKSSLTQYLGELKEYLGGSLGGKELVKEVDDISKGILSGLKKNIPIEEAQKLKVNTANLIKKYYQKLAPMEIEVKKQLTRGIKEEISKVVPEISKLNARDQKLFGLEDALTKALGRLGNREVINMYDLATLGGGALTGKTKSGILLDIAFRTLKSPAIQSNFAIYLNKLANEGAKSLRAGRIPFAIATANLIKLFQEE